MQLKYIESIMMKEDSENLTLTGYTVQRRFSKVTHLEQIGFLTEKSR